MSTRILSVSAMLALAAAGCADPCEEPGTICTVAGSGIDGFNGDGKDALQTDLYMPVDVAVGPDRLTYIVDWNNHRIRRVTEANTVENIVGSGLIGDDDTSGDLNHPTNITFDTQGRLVIAAWHNSKIKRYDFQTKALADICGTGKRAYNGDGGPAAKADLDLPAGVAFSPDGELYIMDQANQMIRRVKGDDTIERYAGRCIIGTPVEGVEPFACPGTGKVTYIPEGEEDRCTRPCAAAYGGDDGPALDARIAQPVGQSADPAGRMAFDPEGNLYFADTKNDRVRMVSKTGVISTVAGTGTEGNGADGLAATATDLNHPTDVDVGPDGTLYIADTFNSCVRARQADGTLKTVAGTCGTRTKSDDALGDRGPATKATLDRPYGIHVDSNGHLYIADTHNGRIRRVLAK